MRFALLLAERPQDTDGPGWPGWIDGRRWHIFLARGAALPGDA
jgi:hypothetical protein